MHFFFLCIVLCLDVDLQVVRGHWWDTGYGPTNRSIHGSGVAQVEYWSRTRLNVSHSKACYPQIDSCMYHGSKLQGSFIYALQLHEKPCQYHSKNMKNLWIIHVEVLLCTNPSGTELIPNRTCDCFIIIAKGGYVSVFNSIKMKMSIKRGFKIRNIFNLSDPTNTNLLSFICVSLHFS